MKKLILLLLIFISIKSFSQNYDDNRMWYYHHIISIKNIDDTSNKYNWNDVFKRNIIFGFGGWNFIEPNPGFINIDVLDISIIGYVNDNKKFNKFTFGAYYNFSFKRKIDNYIQFGAGIAYNNIQEYPKDLVLNDITEKNTISLLFNARINLISIFSKNNIHKFGPQILFNTQNNIKPIIGVYYDFCSPL